MGKLHRDALSLIQAGSSAAGLEQLRHCLEGWGTLTNAIRDVARLARADASVLSPWAVTLEERLRRQETGLSRFRDALSQGAAGAVSEIVSKDLLPMMVEWRSVLGKLAATLENRP